MIPSTTEGPITGNTQRKTYLLPACPEYDKVALKRLFLVRGTLLPGGQDTRRRSTICAHAALHAYHRARGLGPEVMRGTDPTRL